MEQECLDEGGVLHKCYLCNKTKHILYEVSDPVLLEDLITESLEKFEMICKVCNQAMFMDWADHDGMMYKCQKCNNAQYKPKSGIPENENIIESKILKVILEIQAPTIGEVMCQALKYSINNRCNVEFVFKTIKYSIDFNDIFLACKEVK